MIAAIVNGDDFGLAPAINEGILRAHVDGCLTSASLAVVGHAAEEAARAARAAPELGVGLHLTLVEERPLSPPAEIASLLAADGRFHASAIAFARRWMLGRIRPDEVRLETRRQLERIRALGLEPTHLDSHDHLHVLPGVSDIVIEEMRRAGLSRLRNPLERGGSWRAGWTRRAQRRFLNLLARRTAARARKAGCVLPDRFLGFLGAGHIDAASLRARFESLTSGVTELGLHPAAGGGLPRPDYHHWGYRWDLELEALLDPGVHAVIERQGIALIHYGQLPTG